MFIEKLTNDEIKTMVEEFIDAYHLRYSSHPDNHMCEIDKTNKDNYEITFERYSDIRGLQTLPTWQKSTCYMSDFDFVCDNAFLEQKNLTYDYNVLMMRKFGKKYLIELKKHLEKDKVIKVKSYKEEIEEEHKKIINELTR